MDFDFDLDEADAMLRELDLELNGGSGGVDGGGGGNDDLNVAATAGATTVAVAPPPSPPILDNETATYQDLAQLESSQPIMFETLRIDFAMPVKQVPVWFPRRGRAELLDNIIYASQYTGPPEAQRAYWMGASFRDCYYQHGTIRNGYVLRRRRCCLNDAAVPWEWTEEPVAIKELSWPRIREHHYKDDPLTEVAALQFVMKQHQEQQQQQQQSLSWLSSASSASSINNNSHHNITTVLDVLQDADCLFIIMPYYEHRSLADVVLQAKSKALVNAKAVPEEFAKAFFVKMLERLEQLQQFGLCHGDVSLDNFALGIDGNVVLIDFGLCFRIPFYNPHTNAVMPAVLVGDGNHHHHPMLRRLIKPQGPRGTLPYMAPEIYVANHDDLLPFDGYAIDLWGAAVSLFVMLVGEYPWNFPHLANPCYRNVAMDQRPTDERPIQRLDECALGQLAVDMGCRPEYMSPTVCDLLVRMLRHDPQERLTLAQVMEHPWMQSGPRAATQAQMQQEYAMPQDSWRF